MDMQSVARLLINRFGKKRSRFTFFCRHIFDDILDNHCIIRHIGHIIQFYLNLHLTRTADFMVMIFHRNSPVFDHHAHFTPQIISDILRSRYVIAAFLVYFIAVISVRIQTAVPVRLLRIDAVAALSG